LEKRRFSSPREEALTIAHNTRKIIMEGKGDAVSIVRSCLVIANILNKNDEKNRFMKELGGYSKRANIPAYRQIRCHYEVDSFMGVASKDFVEADVVLPIHDLSSFSKRKQNLRFRQDGQVRLLYLSHLNRIMSEIIDSCLIFLNEVIVELQYGGTVEYLMEEIRKNTDEKLVKLDRKLVDEAHSLFLNLTSTNPADWNKVGHSSRKMLKLLADNVFAPRAEPYKMKDGRAFEVGDAQFINRLTAFFDQKVAGEERKFLWAEIEYLESYLRQVVEYAQMGEHKPSIEKYHADMIAIHTYLIISEILKHKD